MLVNEKLRPEHISTSAIVFVLAMVSLLVVKPRQRIGALYRRSISVAPLDLQYLEIVCTLYLEKSPRLSLYRQRFENQIFSTI